MSEQDLRRETRRHAQERVAEIRRELAVGETCAGPAPETWRVAEEELLAELAELELFLLTEELGQCARRALSADRRPGGRLS